ncbi:hypothetical protein GGI23_001043 [Coemansia sp. RSA 2559]|nr:hypothetical protein GGI23_001043 [Coemansia sp. RSA 2559]
MFLLRTSTARLLSFVETAGGLSAKNNPRLSNYRSKPSAWAFTERRLRTNQTTRRLQTTGSFTETVTIKHGERPDRNFSERKDDHLQELTEEQAVILRNSALHDLAHCVRDVSLVRAYHMVRALRRQRALRSKSGKRTNTVIHDTDVILALVRVIKAAHIWEECLPCLNMILEVRMDLLGEHRYDNPYEIAGDVEANDLVPVLEAILSPHFSLMPSRNLAGLTAQQVFSDYRSVLDDSKYRSLAIRAAGFVSDIQHLLTIKETLPMSSLGPMDRFELALAYARCLRPHTALEMMHDLADLSTDQKIELHMAICVSFAETANLYEAKKHHEILSSYSQLWADRSSDSVFHHIATPLQTAVAMVYSSALCILPREPFTENLHSIASSQFRAPSDPAYSKLVVDFHNKTIAALRKQCDNAQWRRLGISRQLFFASCMVYAVTNKQGAEIAARKLKSNLSDQLHSLQHSFLKSFHAKASDTLKYGPMPKTPISLFISGPMARAIVEWELDYATKLIPGFELSVADLEPVLLTYLPPSIRKPGSEGNFADNAAFMIADDRLCFLRLHTIDTYATRVLPMVKKAWTAESTDHRLYPLYIWMLRVQGINNQLMRVLDSVVAVPPVNIKPGTLALVNTRNQVFFEQMFSLASTYRDGSNFAISTLRSMIQNKDSPVGLADRLVATILYCCERSRNFPAALDTMNSLNAKDSLSVPPRIQELFMRVCFASGKISRAMPIFHHLNYGPNGTHISRSSYIQIIEYMGDTRGSVVGAEHSFDAWFQIMLYSGLLTQALVDKWREIGMTKEAQTTPNAFLPRNRSLSEVMEKLPVPSNGYNGPYKSQAIHKWELHMVMALVHAYVKAGMYERARLWEVWIFDSIRSKDLKLRPEKAACMEPVQRCHLQRGSQEGVQASGQVYSRRQERSTSVHGSPIS